VARLDCGMHVRDLGCGLWQVCAGAFTKDKNDGSGKADNASSRAFNVDPRACS
jgi:hypothetical protein